MTTTKQTLVGVVVLVISALVVVGAAWLGQVWKQDRLANDIDSLTCDVIEDCAQ